MVFKSLIHCCVKDWNFGHTRPTFKGASPLFYQISGPLPEIRDPTLPILCLF